MNPEIKELVNAHGIPPDGRLPLAAQRDAEAQREAHAKRARSRTRASAVAVGVVLASTAIFAACLRQPLAASLQSLPSVGEPTATEPSATPQAAGACAPTPAPKGYTALCPPAPKGYKALCPHPAIVFYECWMGGPIVADPKDCPPKEHGGYR